MTSEGQTTVNTKHVRDRRHLLFNSLDDILKDAEALEQHQPIRTTGNWTAPQIIGHVAIFIDWSIDGFPFSAPFPLRIVGKLIKTGAQKRTPSSGIKAFKGIMKHVPAADHSLAEAMRTLRGAVMRVRAGKRMDKPSPLFGKLAHEEWTRIHCRHAELHFSFMHPS